MNLIVESVNNIQISLTAKRERKGKEKEGLKKIKRIDPYIPSLWFKHTTTLFLFHFQCSFKQKRKRNDSMKKMIL
jgi:hypothetical protein